MRGIEVVLHVKTEIGKDPLNHPIYEERPEVVENVLVAPMSTQEILDTLNLTGREAVYQLGIPKKDDHDWKAGSRVTFFGEDWRIVGIPQEGIEDLIPLCWNKKVRVERYEQG